MSAGEGPLSPGLIYSQTVTNRWEQTSQVDIHTVKGVMGGGGLHSFPTMHWEFQRENMEDVRPMQRNQAGNRTEKMPRTDQWENSKLKVRGIESKSINKPNKGGKGGSLKGKLLLPPP